MATVPIGEADFVERLVAGKYTVKMPRHLSLHERWDVWEKDRFNSMESLLKKGDILYDIGAETGEMSAIYAQFVKPQFMVLVEPAPENWQTIKATWDANGLGRPLATYCGLIGTFTRFPEDHKPMEYLDGWPEVAHTNQVWIDRTYRYLHEHSHECSQKRVDDLVSFIGWRPQALTIDVEGAELPVLMSATHTMILCRPLIWVSVHPDLIEKNYNYKAQDLHDYMKGMNYVGELLSDSNEQHWLYVPAERQRT